MKKLILFILLVFSFVTFSQSENFRFKSVLEKAPNELTTFCVANNEKNIKTIKEAKIKIKFSSKNWIFVTATPSWIAENQKKGAIDQFYFEFAPPTLMNDSARVVHHVDEVQSGLGGLESPYTGENIIMGIVDTGLDFTHPDLKDANGKTRVLRYWDQSASAGANTYTYYNYGRLWDSTAINNGTCTAIDNSSHGTMVSGRVAGNALANGKEKGMAPNSKIVMVETNLNAANWTLTVADACDYIFKYADSLGLPAVINLSLGTYFGSHDGNDPATEYIEQLLDEKSGRIVVCAAGNAGAKGKFHVHGNVLTDTSFVWLLNNPSSAIAANSIYLDLWADEANATNIEFAMGADKPAPDYGFRGNSNFINLYNLAGTVVYDTIYNASHQRIATIEYYPEIVYNNFHLEVFVSRVDSTSYYYRLMTRGSGEYDAWSGAWQGVNDFVTTIPSSSIIPEIGNYQMPDSLQSIVSAWNCSEKIISVGNIRARNNHIDANGNLYTTQPTTIAIGQNSHSSSKGPSRKNVVKPDVVATGDFALSAGPIAYMSTHKSSSDIDGWHMRNNGTSFSSPVVAGIAALYLEKCNVANYQNFKDELIATAFSDNFTGTLPNFAYGYGKPHALNLLLHENNYTLNGGNTICGEPLNISVSSATTVDSVIWSNGINNFAQTINTVDTLFATIYFSNGCHFNTDTIAYQINSIDSINGNNGICIDPIEISSYATGNVDSLIWSNNTYNDTTSIVAPGNYTITYYFNSGCIIDSTINVSSHILAPSNLISSNGTTICGNPLDISVNSYSVADSILWYNGSNLETISINSPQDVYTTVYFPNNCIVNSDTLSINLNKIDSILGNIGICLDPIEISSYATGNADSIIWSNNIHNDTTLINSAGNYSVTYYFNSGCVLDSTFTVTSKILTSTNLVSPSGEAICGAPLIITTSASNIADSIVWHDGSNLDNISISIPQQVFATIYYPENCSINTDTLTISLNNIDSITGNIGICTDPIELEAFGFGTIDSIVWSNGMNDNVASFNSAGNYSVTYYFNSGCELDSSFTIAQKTVLPNPVIYYNGNQVSSDSQPNYQWMLDNVLIPNANSQDYTYGNNYGVYSSYVVSVDGCISNSNNVTITAGLTQNYLSEKIKIAPNPFNDEIQIVTDLTIVGVKLFDSKGSLIKNIENKNVIINTSDLKSGIYNIEINTEKGIFHSKLTKM